MVLPDDQYLIKGDEPPEPRQFAEHSSVSRRATAAIYISGVAVAVTAIIAFFTWQQVDIAHKGLKLAEDANKLNASMLKAANAAFFEPTFVMSPTEGYVDVGFQNTGKAPALHLSVTLVISRKTIPGYNIIGDVQTVNLERGEIPPIKPSVGQTVALHGYSQDERTLIERTREAVSVEGKFQYENGFGDLEKEEICLLYVSVHNREGGGSSGFMPCEDAKSAVYKTTGR